MMLNKFKRKELFRFLIGGGCAVFTDYSSYSFLLYLGANVSNAKAISFIMGSIVGFIINKIWTFESKTFSKSEIVRYSILYFVTAYINVITNKMVLLWFSINFLAFLCATGISTLLNFLGQKFFVFVIREKGEGL